MRKKYVKSNNKRNAGTYSCLYEVTWYTMYKRPVLNSPIWSVIKEETAKTAKKNNFEIVQLRVDSNAVTLQMSLPPEIAPHFAIQTIKKELAVKIRSHDSRLSSKLPCMWSSGYLLSTIGRSPNEEETRKYKESLPNSRVGKKK